MNPGKLVLARTVANASYHGRIPDELAERLPDTVCSAHLVADRRGSRVWWIRLHNGHSLALKYCQPDRTDVGGVRPHTAELAVREAAVCSIMAGDNPTLLEAGYLYAHGRAGDGSWIAVRWLQNPNLRQTWSRCQRTAGKARP